MIEKRITDFIKEHHVLTLAVSNNNIPYCANCFYVYSEEDKMLIFTSDKDTRHISDSENNTKVAASIVLETKQVGKIQGLQINRKLIELKNDILKKANKLYLKKYPYAILAKTNMWGINLEYIKMTDNRLGFGKKLIWESHQ